MRIQISHPPFCLSLSLLLSISVWAGSDSTGEPVNQEGQGAQEVHEVPSVTRTQMTRPLHPLWLPLMLPASMVVPGTAHAFRGESRTRSRLMRIGLLSWATVLGSATTLALTGASDPVIIPTVPILVFAGTTLMTAGISDLVGAFSGRIHDADLPRSDPASATTLVRFEYLHAPSEILNESGFFGLNASHWFGDWQASAAALSTPDRNAAFYSVRAAYRLWSPFSTPAELRHGLRPEVFLERSTQSRAGFGVWRLGAQLRFAFWGGEIASTLSSLTYSLWLGYFHEWATFEGAPGITNSTGASGGFESRWAAFSWLRPLFGYDHARTGPIGGSGSGYFGVFYSGLDFRILEHSWFSVQRSFGTPDAWHLRWKMRW